MQGYVDEIEYLKNSEDQEESDENNGESKDQILKLVKNRIFNLFFRLNTMKVSIPIHYHMLMIFIEGFQLLTLVMVDGEYSKIGPFGDSSPWNLDQTQWLIDVCWIFRVDRYLRTSFTTFIILLGIWGFLIVSTLVLGVVIAWKQRTSSTVLNFLIKLLKALITVLGSIFFIPILDTFAFAIKCSSNISDECYGLSEGYEYMIIYLAATLVFLGLMTLCGMLYYDMCLICGGTMAKPHPRFKLLRLASYAIIVAAYYFISTSGKEIFFLVVSLCVGLILCYAYIQYIPYYNRKMCNMRLSTLVVFTAAVFCALIGELFKQTDQSNSSVTMLFYFLTPCLVQISHLAMLKRGKKLMERGVQQLTNPYQVEIKARMLVFKLEEAKNKNSRSLYGENQDEERTEEFHTLQVETLNELETLYNEGIKKFPNSEYLYLWAGLLQLHIFENYILAMVLCFKGIIIANKIDSQYALYHFRRTSESFYKAHMKDDAYDYELFEKAFLNAQKNDEAVTRSQFYFWAELESRNPKIQKLTKLAGETATMIGVAKGNYQRLLKLNSKNTQALRMYGWFLSSLNNFSDMGQRYLNKAEMQEEAQQKNMNANMINSLTQPLSFFDSDNSILRISGDFETVGEIQKANAAACQLLGYLSAELIGRNISLIIPSPFSESHDEYIKKFHESGKYSIIDNQQLILYFTNKNNFIFEGRLLVKVVPNEGQPPFLAAIIKPTNPNYEVILMNKEFMVTGVTQKCTELFELSNSKNSEQKITNFISDFENLKSAMKSENGVEYIHVKERIEIKLRLKLKELVVGSQSACIIKIENLSKPEPSAAAPVFDLPMQDIEKPSSENVKTVSSILAPGSQLDIDRGQHENPSNPDSSQEESSEEESSGEEGSSSEGSEESENNSSDQDDSKGSKESSAESEENEDSEESEEVQEESKESSDLNDSDEKDLTESDDSSQSQDDGQEQSGEHNDHSSSKSMNSSMASQAHFNKSIKALVAFEFSKTKKHVLRFKITLILTILILIVTSILTFEVIETSVHYNETLSHYVNLVGNLRLYSHSLSYYVRMISLMDTGVIPEENKDLYFDWIEEDIEDMHDINLQLYKNYDVLDSDDRDVYILEDIATWLLEGTNIREYKSNLFDATSNFILQGYLLKEEYPDSPYLDLDNRRAFYLYRNGIGETLQYLNISASFYVKSAIKDLESQRLTAILLILVSVVLLLFCAGFAIIPVIFALEKSRREVWEIFFEIPGYVCRVMKAKCSDRLNILNEQANMELEEQNAEETNIEHDKPRDESHKINDNLKRDDPKRKKQALDQKKILAYDPKQRKVMILKLACFFVISLVYFYLIYYTGFDAVGDVLEEEPQQINWGGRRRQLSRSINMWVMEALFENYTDVGYKFQVPTGQNLGSPYNEAIYAIEELDYVENSLIFGNEEAGLAFSEMRSEEHDDLLFENACDVDVDRSKSDCETVGDKALVQGLHSALGMYTTSARSLLLRIKDLQEQVGGTSAEVKQFFSDPDMVLLRDMDNHYLYDPLKKASELYEEDYRSYQDDMKVWQNVLMSLYCVFSLLFFFFVYAPMINKIGFDTNNAWSMCTLIPQEYQEDFKKLSVAIKERRDHFKWR